MDNGGDANEEEDVDDVTTNNVAEKDVGITIDKR